MARFLSRSKSHRELRTKFVLDSHEELPSFHQIPQQQQQQQPHTPAKLIRRRAGTTADRSTTNRLMKQKSVDSVLRPSTGMSGGSSQRTAKFGDQFSPSTKPVNYIGIHPPRTSSRVSLHSPTNAVPRIGVALGSPTGVNESSIAIDTPSTVLSGVGSTPAFILPPEPFEVVYEDRKTSTSNGASESGERGWRKLFGRSLFGTRKLSKKQQQSSTPYMTKCGSSSQSSSQTVTENSPIPNIQATPPPQFPLLNPPSSKPAQKSNIVSTPCLLDVNIPSTEMERYSIMFSALLQKDCLLEVPQRKPSLYDRRHERKRSNTTTGAIIKKDPPRLHLSPLKRHATTGGRNNPRSSPNVFDSDWPPSNAVGIAYSRSPLGRSNTTAATLSSMRPSSSEGRGFVLAGEELENITQDSRAAENLKRSESGSSKMTQQDPSIDTPRGSFDEGDDEWLQRIDNEPICPASAISNGLLWEMIKNNPDQPIPIPPIKNEQEAVIAAEISIARQISVSQRQLNHPVLSRLDSTTNRYNYHHQPIAIKRQQSAKVMTPRIVNTRSNKTRVRESQNVEYGDVATLDSNSAGSIGSNSMEEEKDAYEHNVTPSSSASAAMTAVQARAAAAAVITASN